MSSELLTAKQRQYAELYMADVNRITAAFESVKDCLEPEDRQDVEDYLIVGEPGIALEIIEEATGIKVPGLVLREQE